MLTASLVNKYFPDATDVTPVEKNRTSKAGGEPEA
jgi:hypothetical protein